MIAYLHLSPREELLEQLRDFRELVKRAELCREARQAIGLSNLDEAHSPLSSLQTPVLALSFGLAPARVLLLQMLE